MLSIVCPESIMSNASIVKGYLGSTRFSRRLLAKKGASRPNHSTVDLCYAARVIAHGSILATRTTAITSSYPIIREILDTLETSGLWGKAYRVNTLQWLSAKLLDTPNRVIRITAFKQNTIS